MAKQLSLEEARTAVQEAVAVFNEPNNASQLTALRNAAGPDIIKLMTTVTPIAIALASPIVTKYGFEPNQPGVMQFIFAIQAHSSDTEIAQQIAQLKAQFLPPNFQMPPMFAQPPATAPPK